MYKVKIYNEYQIDGILKSDKTNFNNFYKDELVVFLERARQLLIKPKETTKDSDKD